MCFSLTGKSDEDAHVHVASGRVFGRPVGGQIHHHCAGVSLRPNHPGTNTPEATEVPVYRARAP